MEKLYRPLGRRSVRVTVEVPVSVVAVLVAYARANGLLSQTAAAAPHLPGLLSLVLCNTACLDAHYIADEGDGFRCFDNSGDDLVAIPFPGRLFEVLPYTNDTGAVVPLSARRPWWLKPGKGPKYRRWFSG